MPTPQEREMIENGEITKEDIRELLGAANRLCDRLPDGGNIDRRRAVLDGKADMERFLSTPNAGGEFRRDSDVNSTALLADSGGEK